IMVDHTGAIVDGDEILFILARHQLMQETPATGVAGTLMSNIGLELALRELGIAFKRAKVGDRHVMQMLEQEGWTLGGETSRHIICLDKTSSGDGIIAALQVLTCIVNTRKSLYELKQGMRKYPQTMINVPLSNGTNPCEDKVVKQAVLEAEHVLNGQGREIGRAHV